MLNGFFSEWVSITHMSKNGKAKNVINDNITKQCNISFHSPKSCKIGVVTPLSSDNHLSYGNIQESFVKSFVLTDNCVLISFTAAIKMIRSNIAYLFIFKSLRVLIC
jgi:hypothetical protein